MDSHPKTRLEHSHRNPAGFAAGLRQPCRIAHAPAEFVRTLQGSCRAIPRPSWLRRVIMSPIALKLFAQQSMRTWPVMRATFGTINIPNAGTASWPIRSSSPCTRLKSPQDPPKGTGINSCKGRGNLHELHNPAVPFDSWTNLWTNSRNIAEQNSPDI